MFPCHTNRTQLTQQGKIGVPFGFSGNIGLQNEPSLRVEGSMTFPKILGQLASSQHLKSDCTKHANPISYDDNTFMSQLQGVLAGHNIGYSNIIDFTRHCPQLMAINGAGLVLDTDNGELVSASKMTPKELMEAKALAASKSHSEAERRRRERINSHLATLRTLLPSSAKTDKASLLAEVIDEVKMLKRKVSELYELGPMPTDIDELIVEKDTAWKEDKMLMKASLCCDDRPDLLSDIVKALDTLGLRTLKAEISTLGGRVKNVLVMTLKDTSDQKQGPSVNIVQEALRQVMDRPSGGELSGTSSKRQRLSSFEALGSTSV